jgi:hypothetical protein
MCNANRLAEPWLAQPRGSDFASPRLANDRCDIKATSDESAVHSCYTHRAAHSHSPCEPLQIVPEPRPTVLTPGLGRVASTNP